MCDGGDNKKGSACKNVNGPADQVLSLLAAFIGCLHSFRFFWFILMLFFRFFCFQLSIPSILLLSALVPSIPLGSLGSKVWIPQLSVLFSLFRLSSFNSPIRVCYFNTPDSLCDCFCVFVYFHTVSIGSVISLASVLTPTMSNGQHC